MATFSNDTIAALATGLCTGSVAIVRLSGPQTRPLLEAMIQGSLPKPQHLGHREILHWKTKATLDYGLIVFFPGPHSLTGEDVGELHLHGNILIAQAVLRAVNSWPGCRLAERGEFARRALMNGKMDLTEVEGLADLMEAQTSAQHEQALRQMGGALSIPLEGWRTELLKALAWVEASLDFSDEDDRNEEAWITHASLLAQKVFDEITRTLHDERCGERLRHGATVVLVGAPNSGKSTLLNALAQRDVALVSPHAGTTRDALEVAYNLQGLPVTFVDTAGLRFTNDNIEALGIERTHMHMRQADIVVLLHPINDDSSPPEITTLAPVLKIRTKSDLHSYHSIPSSHAQSSDVMISAHTGDGLDTLINHLREVLLKSWPSTPPIITRERHREALQDAHAALCSFLHPNASLLPAELRAEDLRLATRAIGRITGHVDCESMLDALFSSLCIGK
jgi:tRNA modification GTPase